MKNHQVNIVRIKAVYNALGPLKDKVVFVGGATVSLQADRQAAEVRPTSDVDILIEVSSRWHFAEIEQLLRNMGFQNDPDATFIGRYIFENTIVDILPADKDILGFANRWYEGGLKTAIDYIIDDQHTIKIFTPPYFIGSKLEAFKSRGGNDGRTSGDFEDIIFVLENRSTIWEEMAAAENPLRSYLTARFREIVNNDYGEEWVAAHINFRSPQGLSTLMNDMKNFISVI